MPRVKWHACGHCGEHFDGATDPFVPDAKPHDGSLMICIRCHGVSLWRKGDAPNEGISRSHALRVATQQGCADDYMRMMAALQERGRWKPRAH